MKQTEYVTDRELAAMLKMSPKWGHNTIKRLARIGKIKGALKVGDQWRFDKCKAIESLAANR